MLSLSPIAYVKTSFKEKFGVPRQSGMIAEARGVIKFIPDPNFRDALRGLEAFSHLWIIFHFHAHFQGEAGQAGPAGKDGEVWRPLISPPRLDGPKRVGVLASRSPDRPNRLGLSVVKIESIHLDAKDGIEIEVSGVDLLDGTPVLDIKPYLPYVDIVSDASGAWTASEIPKYEVSFSNNAISQLADGKLSSSYKNLLIKMLELDPRPTSQKKVYSIMDEKNDGRSFAFRLDEFDVKWEIRNQGIWVRELTPLN